MLPSTIRCIPGCLESKECYLGWAGEQELGMGRAGRAWHSRALTAPGWARGSLQAGANSLMGNFKFADFYCWESKADDPEPHW